MKKFAIIIPGIILALVFALAADFTTNPAYTQLTPTIPAYLPAIFNPPPTPTLPPTPLPTATQPGPTATPTPTVAPANVRIAFILYGPTNGPLEEYVEIQNTGGTAATMTNWTLSDESNRIFTFPTFNLPAGGLVRVWTKSGTNTSTDLYWGSGQAIWNNNGDTAYLRNAAGTLVSVCSYAGGGTSHICP